MTDPAYDAKTAETLGARYPHMLRTLRRARVSHVRMRYAGRYDLKRFDDLVFVTRQFKASRRRVSHRICAQLRAEFEALLDQRYPQWERFEGARGEFIWDVNDDALTHQHDVRTAFHTTTQTEGFQICPSTVPVEVHPMLVVSTAHVSEREAQLFDENDCSRRGEYGWLVYVGDDFDAMVPKVKCMSRGLKGVLRFAYQHKCMYVLFDRDAQRLVNVPTYPWAGE